MLIIDAHEDIAYNALEWGRDIRQSVQAVRRREQLRMQGDEYLNDIAMSGLPQLRQGGFGIVFGTIFVEPQSVSAAEDIKVRYTQSYRNAEEAHRVGKGQLSYYRELAEEPGVSLILNQGDLKELLMAWEHTREDDADRPFGIVPLMEGADPIRTPEEAAEWFAQGVRIVGLAWQGTRYSGGTHAPGPLTPAGKELLREMERCGLALDISHLAEESFWQALELFHGPVIASHSNCRAFVPTDRHLSDEMIKALAERDAVIGMVFANPFIDKNWTRQNRFPISLDQVVKHIDHICQLTGSARHIGIGTDIDGGFGREETPAELDTVADTIKLAEALRKAGYKEEDVIGIMSGNWQRFLERALPLQ
ncbi:peptidase M19 [Ktedonosporobacter rubrisoli]|uniref:Peptidase M19 n=1 Tax=Ktedonosporobacter rubrisoli TaxID=2509675 RepID=A0A4P6JVX5_KTERU|nr:membrane dipeptidase [Ktedonosporobacter rubrisoli]QBD79605.1 peptidase M19 [Ktedonosporobacter rubrisoli]